MHRTQRIFSQVSRSFSTDASKRFNEALRTELGNIRAAGTYKGERIITSQQTASIHVAGRSKPVLNFCANNYLGLANNPEVMAAAKKMIDSHGFGLASVRFICGTQDIHKELERTIAKFHGMEDAILYPSCFDANGGLFEGILTEQDAIISDSLNHASIIDGIRLAKAQRLRYNHLDMEDLKKQLQAAQSARFRLVMTDGAFSMDGDVAPLRQICALAEEYDAMVAIDECHAGGFFGPGGRGTPAYHGVEGRVHIINSTLGKALGGATGGYTASSKEVVEMLRQRSRPYLFSNTIPPPVVGASLAVFNMLMRSTELVDKLRGLVGSFRQRLTAAGFTVLGAPDHPIAPVLLGDARLAGQFAEAMLDEGIYVIGFSYPVVPKGQARIRVQLSAAHSQADVDKCVQAFITVGKKLKVIA